MIRFSYSDPFLPHRYKQQLIFHNKLHDRKRLQLPLRFSVSYFILCVLCGVQKSDEFLTSSPPCAASESVETKFFLLVFLLLLRSDSSPACISNKVRRKGLKKCLTHIKMWPKLPDIYITVDP